MVKSSNNSYDFYTRFFAYNCIDFNAMYRFCLLLLLLPTLLWGQTMPEEGAQITYRLIGFSWKPEADAGKYKIELAGGNIFSTDSFTKKIVSTFESNEAKLIGLAPAWGRQYTWRVVFKPKKGRTQYSDLHHFAVGKVTEVDTDKVRLRITKHSEKYKDHFVFLDGNRALYDMNGQSIWYLPNVEGRINPKTFISDLKLTSQGTITFIADDKRGYEINYKGEVLWKGPNNDATDKYKHYHHEFTRTTNGHYMLLSTEPGLWKAHQPSADNKSLYTVADTNTNREGYQLFPFGTLVEYDEAGKVVWEWNTRTYFESSDLAYINDVYGNKSYDVHVNSFYFDEKAKEVYLSFRNTNRIIKIKYPEGTVLNTIGQQYKAGNPAKKEEDLFSGQHSVKYSENGYIYLYNNNTRKQEPSNIPSVQKINIQGEKIWEYKCAAIDSEYKFVTTMGPTRGGNVIELPGDDMFISTSTDYTNIFIVSKDKKLLWRGVPELWERWQKKWIMYQQYRANVVTRNELEQMIWHQ